MLQFPTGSAVSNRGRGENLIDALLDEQQQLTAVERFSQKLEGGIGPALEPYYRDLVPLSKPATGEQYAFEVDLDACSGCKACVTACHSLNGLDEDESWRDVGVLFGGTVLEPVQRTVTSACHHCADPACADGCPVLAYDKDGETGVVRHLDDQCIGCKYCQLKCPYDVPKYNKRRGIVRKCDMCQDRLSEGEAPQACPNRAIAIRIVSRDRKIVSGDVLVPGVFDSSYTRPSTIYLAKNGLGGNLEAADARQLEPVEAHFPLVVMLVLTQMAVGMFVLDWLAGFVSAAYAGSVLKRSFFVTGALLVGSIGLGVSLMHLGRPLQAWRAFLGWRKSWLSREIIAFNLLFTLAGFYVLLHWLPLVPAVVKSTLGFGVAAAGALAVLTSVMVYVDTRRSFWSFPRTAGRFVGTVLVFAPVAMLAVLPAWSLAVFCTVVLLVKLALEGKGILAVMKGGWNITKRSAMVQAGPLRPLLVTRVVCALAGIIACLCAAASGVVPMALLATIFVAVGELAERALFFQAVDTPKMPGGV